MTNPKLCKDCAHAKYLTGRDFEARNTYGLGSFDRGYYCSRTERSVSSDSVLVSGLDKKRMTPCVHERDRWFGCGKKAKFFEPEPTHDQD